MSAVRIRHCPYALMAELADAYALGAYGKPWGFDSLSVHLTNNKVGCIYKEYCVCHITAIILAFQARDAGSTPATRSERFFEH